MGCLRWLLAVATWLLINCAHVKNQKLAIIRLVNWRNVVESKQNLSWAIGLLVTLEVAFNDFFSLENINSHNLNSTNNRFICTKNLSISEIWKCLLKRNFNLRKSTRAIWLEAITGLNLNYNPLRYNSYSKSTHIHRIPRTTDTTRLHLHTPHHSTCHAWHTFGESQYAYSLSTK